MNINNVVSEDAEDYMQKLKAFNESKILENIEQLKSFDSQDIIARCAEVISCIRYLDLPERVDVLNEIREMLAALSPFETEPVDQIRWVRSDEVYANDYNPNSVAPPEMELLRHSIISDGYTQPIVTWKTEKGYEVVDGFHRNRVCKECDDVRSRVHDYLPVTVIRGDREGRNDRIASTIRHNRARGKHKVDSMSDIVIELKRRNWSPARIGKELGMDADEVLRLCQITGLAEMFKDDDFNEAWEHESALDESEINLEWMSQSVLVSENIGWVDRTDNHSVLYGEDGQLGSLQKSRFVDNEWFCYAYCKPTREARKQTKKLAKQWIEEQFNDKDLSSLLDVGRNTHKYVESP